MRILIVLLIMFGLQVQAQNLDSAMTRWVNGKKYILHRISPKETYSSLSRQYHVPVAEIQAANPKSTNLKIGETVNIPVNSSTPTKSSDTNIPATISKPSPVTDISLEGNSKKTHTVQKGETLYAISKSYNMNVDDLKKLNGLNSNAVSIGQKLKVLAISKTVSPIQQEVGIAAKVEKVVTENSSVESKVNEESTPAPKEIVTTPVVIESTKAIENKSLDSTELPKVYNNPGTSRTSVIEKDPKSGVEVEKVTEIGVATWITESDLNQNKFYALHRTAPVGSIIKVTNRMNNNSVFVKVVGTLPDTGDNNAAIIKITQAAAQRIGAIDQKFTAELSYGLTR
ncbi:MAG: LysM peptidoglycan-binding domain-containing protein [Bacteroidetes bacterium]|nr:LysM peptidoglycan-binding domain-containing protein [Bacteroidota bacterium]